MSPRVTMGRPGVTGRRLARRWVPAVAAAAALVCGTTVAGSVAPPSSSADPSAMAGWDFITRPDLHPPQMQVTTPANGTAPGNVLIAPVAPAATGGQSLSETGQAGALIVDNAGQPVWFEPTEPGMATMNFRVQKYQGKPVLTYFQGKVVVPPGYGQGEGVILDQHYNKIATVRAGNGLQADLHDFTITPQNTALITAYKQVPYDLTPVGGPPNGQILDCVVQEVDIASGKVLSEWHSLDHIDIKESAIPLPPDPTTQPWDYFHINSVVPDGDSNLLVSARNTNAVYQLNRTTGDVNWRLGGKLSDFPVAPEDQFQLQHDAVRLPDGTISVFDDGAFGIKKASRGEQLGVDEVNQTAEEVRSDWRPDPIVSPNMGNYQLMPGGNSFVNWGGAPGVTEFGPDHSVRFAAHFVDGMASYRAYRIPWVGLPTDAPAVVAQAGANDSTSVYASWNGATQVTGWRVLTGADPAHLTPVQDAPRAGFETRVDVPGQQPYAAVQALDANGAVIGNSPPVKLQR